ncbi:hypothetical protein SAMN04488564_104473 [Lentzea waywayandensis]|uniref:Uncharacterized protein n=1 Tax=Lentzea waywayandensis TaxID=84724 RepID=A0A1I6EHA2_9PSEU|nr:hypothetical protein [Lentzea waywayandensis]SFR16928.1 hypothetical protein SAMN04488564_104473 [Lentzea waywayandensis]
MSAKVGFFADVVQTGTVLGLDANLGPDVAAEVMGGLGGENRSGRAYWRSYGLVEVGWYRRERELGWQGEHLAVQAHRLEYGDDWLDDAVAAKYGRFGGVVMFDELAAELGRRRVELVAVGRPEFGHQLYWQPDAQVTLYVGVDPEFRPGSVRKIFTAFGQDLTISFDGDHRVVWQQLRALAAMPVEERIRWAERQTPEDFRSWWRYCARLLAARTASHDAVPERPTFVELAFWMWEHGIAKGVYAPKEVAYLRAGFAARVEELYPELALPSHDELVGACLDHVSEPMAREDKNLVDAARLLRHGLHDTSRFDAIYERRGTV